jgi:ethanolamine permease
VNSETTLKRSLGPLTLWGLGVGYVISGMYFGWNLGLAEGGTLGLGIATVFVITMYITFTFCYTELACAIPKAGGAFDYANRAFGPVGGFFGGVAQIVEFVFAPPAIAAAIGAYFHAYLPGLSTLSISVVVYIIFTGLNIYGVKTAAIFELVITILAVLELLIFAGLTLPSFEVVNLTRNALPHGYSGVFAAIPFAIWFFLAIEGVANVAEETHNPQRNILVGFGSALLTLIVLCLLTFASSVGVAGWEAVVFDSQGELSDTPLPMALKIITGQNALMYHLLLTVGLIGLVASFNGIILAAGRATYEFAKVGFAPKIIGTIHPKFRTPATALVVNMLLGFLALLTGKTGDIIVIAVFGALSLYIISMLAFLKLRKTEPDLKRPFRAPCYPVFPLVALVIAFTCLVSMTVYNHRLAMIYVAMVAGLFVLFKWTSRK